jgi:hypothetical protein
MAYAKSWIVARKDYFETGPQLVKIYKGFPNNPQIGPMDGSRPMGRRKIERCPGR